MQPPSITSVRRTALLAAALALAAGTLAAQREPVATKPRAGAVGRIAEQQQQPGGAPSPGENGAASQPAGGSTGPVCSLTYQRADNMWAAPGRPEGQLGVESITLKPGESATFVTDWKFEKLRGDGTARYGSHLRRATNAGAAEVKMLLRSLPETIKNAGGTALGVGNMISGVSTVLTIAAGVPGVGGVVGAMKEEQSTLAPGQSNDYKHDLVQVICP